MRVPAVGFGIMLLAADLLAEESTQQDLGKRLLAGDRATRRAAAKELRKLGPKAEAAIPSLIQAIDDSDYQVADLSAQALVNCGRASVLPIAAKLDLYRRPGTKSLKRLQASHRSRLIAVLRELGAAAEAATPTLDRIVAGDDTVHVRAEAAWALWRIRASERQSLELLVRLLREGARAQDDGACVAAASGLADMGPNALEAIPVLLGAVAVKWRPSDGREIARSTLLGFGTKGIPILVNSLKDPANAEAAAEILARLGEPSLPPLIATVKGGETPECRWAAHALGLLGERAESSLPALRGQLNKASGNFLVAVAHAYWVIASDAEPAVAALVRALKDPSASVRASAAMRLLRMGEHARAALPALSARLDDPDEIVRRAARRAIDWIGRRSAK